MNILKYAKKEIMALVKDGIATPESITHWEVCESLAEGKTIESVAEKFRMHPRHISYIKANKCRECRP